MQVQENDEVMLITNNGTLIRTAVDGISTLGRNTQGVKLIRTSAEEKLVQVVRVVNEDDAEEGGDDSGDSGGAADDQSATSESDTDVDESETDDGD